MLNLDNYKVLGAYLLDVDLPEGVDLSNVVVAAVDLSQLVNLVNLAVKVEDVVPETEEPDSEEVSLDPEVDYNPKNSYAYPEANDPYVSPASVFLSKDKTQLVFESLQRGNAVTEGQAKARWGVRNLRAIISSLRDQGIEIRTVPAEGRRKTAYVMYETNTYRNY